MCGPDVKVVGALRWIQEYKLNTFTFTFMSKSVISLEYEHPLFVSTRLYMNIKTKAKRLR